MKSDIIIIYTTSVLELLLVACNKYCMTDWPWESTSDQPNFTDACFSRAMTVTCGITWYYISFEYCYICLCSSLLCMIISWLIFWIFSCCLNAFQSVNHKWVLYSISQYTKDAVTSYAKDAVDNELHYSFVFPH